MCYMLVCYQLLLFTKRPDKVINMVFLLVSVYCTECMVPVHVSAVSFVLPVLLLWNGYIQRQTLQKQACGHWPSTITVGLLLLLSTCIRGALLTMTCQWGFLSDLRSVNPLLTVYSTSFYTMKLSLAVTHIPTCKTARSSTP